MVACLSKNPPHFHVRYDDYRCTITISKGVVKGQLPRKALKKLYELGVAA